MSMRIVMVVAVSENGVIGRDGTMPWHLPSDLKRFKSITTGHPIIMGRRTWDTLEQPLPDRHNIVMTRDRTLVAPGATPVHDADGALSAAGDADTIMVIGGGEIYRRFLDRADCVELTRIHTTIDGDTSFPELSRDTWECTQRIEHPADERHAFSMTFETWERKPSRG